MKLLIATSIDDTHAHIVQRALQEIGHEVELWYTSGIAQGQAHTLYLDDNQATWLSDFTGEHVMQEYQLVWYRRPKHPVLLDGLHADDVESAKKENSMFYQTLWQFILPNALWINPPNAISRVNSKILQLKVAKSLGMNVPKTVVSNYPNMIKEFIIRHAPVVYKSLYPLSWITGNQINLTYTSQIDLVDLPNDYLLKSVPGIYQEKINKQYELRVTYFGDKYVAVKIYSQEHNLATLDWRAAPTKELRLEQVDLPEAIDKACRAFMAEFGIVFGCFDFIVTDDNQYYFLEINEQGQFLWIEEVNPNIKMLNAFINFLLRYAGEKHADNNVSLLDYISAEPSYA